MVGRVLLADDVRGIHLLAAAEAVFNLIVTARGHAVGADHVFVFNSCAIVRMVGGVFAEILLLAVAEACDRKLRRIGPDAVDLAGGGHRDAVRDGIGVHRHRIVAVLAGHRRGALRVAVPFVGDGGARVIPVVRAGCFVVNARDDGFLIRRAQLTAARAAPVFDRARCGAVGGGRRVMVHPVVARSVQRHGFIRREGLLADRRRGGVGAGAVLQMGSGRFRGNADIRRQGLRIVVMHAGNNDCCGVAVALRRPGPVRFGGLDVGVAGFGVRLVHRPFAVILIDLIAHGDRGGIEGVGVLHAGGGDLFRSDVDLRRIGMPAAIAVEGRSHGVVIRPDAPLRLAAVGVLFIIIVQGLTRFAPLPVSRVVRTPAGGGVRRGGVDCGHSSVGGDKKPRIVPHFKCIVV